MDAWREPQVPTEVVFHYALSWLQKYLVPSLLIRLSLKRRRVAKEQLKNSLDAAERKAYVDQRLNLTRCVVVIGLNPELGRWATNSL